ncbi:MAG: hypothetical protein ACERKD_07125 [Prolixibacteraceae bacterium]
MLDKTIGKVQVDAPKIYKKELVEFLFEQPYSKIEFVVNLLKRTYKHRTMKKFILITCIRIREVK